jgi:uncharacterized protein YceK
MYTVSTDASDPEAMKKDACNNNCTMPRMYSGTAMDICGFTSENSGQGGAIMFWDMFFSIVADTVVLPYTTVMQVKHGNISSTKKCSSESNATITLKQESKS